MDRTRIKSTCDNELLIQRYKYIKPKSLKKGNILSKVGLKNKKRDD